MLTYNLEVFELTPFTRSRMQKTKNGCKLFFINLPVRIQIVRSTAFSFCRNKKGQDLLRMDFSYTISVERSKEVGL